MDRPHSSLRTPTVGAAPNPLPRPEASTISAELLQREVDRAAHLNLLSVPAAGGQDGAILDGGRRIGVRVDEVLHRFEIRTGITAAPPRLRTANRVGEAVGRFRHRWLMVPDDYVAVPGAAPPATAWVPERSQRFVMLDGRCTFGDGDDGFVGFGAGRTFPVPGAGIGRSLVTAVGTVLQGFGGLRDLDQGTYVYCGTLDSNRGFTGSLLVRLLDPAERLRTERSLPALGPQPSPEEGVTYLVLRGEAVPSDPVSPYLGPDGRPIGLIVQQGLRLHFMDCAVWGGRGLRAADRVGRLIGRITAYVVFDPQAAGGSLLDPIPFVSYDEMVLFDEAGNPFGGITADSNEGRVFNLSISGQPAIRFGGVGQIRGGSGPLEGIRGLMTDNSVVVFDPHVSASVYVLRIDDPDGRFAGAV